MLHDQNVCVNSDFIGTRQTHMSEDLAPFNNVALALVMQQLQQVKHLWCKKDFNPDIVTALEVIVSYD